MRSVVVAAAAIGLVLAPPLHACEDEEPMTYEPRDECRADPGAAAFLDALARAVEARDADALLALSAANIQLDYGGGEGRDELRDRLVNGGEAYGDLWKELATVLSLGCAFDGEATVSLPWYFSQDFGEADIFSTMLAMGPEVRIRAEAADEAKVLATLNWSAVDVPGAYDPAKKFTQVALPDGTKGFVETAALRSLIDYRLVAERKDGGWQITAFIAGD